MIKLNTTRTGIKSTSLYETITDNFGDKFPQLYGTRNMRVVLHGVVYRGGANNVYNKFNKRDNKNPLPEQGLENLLKEVSTAIYLYNNQLQDSKKSYGPR